MKRFWEFKNIATEEQAELLLYGPIYDSRSWWDDSDSGVTAKEFMQELYQLGGKKLLVRINSPGGDVFAAHAIYNQLQTYPGEVNIIIDGLAASAATIVAMAGNQTTIPSNAVMMIHNPMLGLYGYYSADEMGKMISQLATIKDSIIEAYKRKCKLTTEALSELMNSETWMSAAEALEYGFADILESNMPVAMNIIGDKLAINNINHNLDSIPNVDKLQVLIAKSKAINNKKSEQGGKNEMGQGNKWDEVVAILKNAFGSPANVATPTVTENNTDAITQERKRIQDLQALNTGSASIKALVDDAINKGLQATDIKNTVDIITANEPKLKTEQDAVNFITNLIKDNQNSGAGSVGAKGGEPDQNEAQANVVNIMVETINKKFKR